MKTKKASAVLIGMLLAAVTVSAQAPIPILPILQVTRVVVKPDRVGDFREIERQYSEAYKKGGGVWRRVYQGRAANPFEFVIIQPLPNLAFLDGQTYVAKGASETEIARLQARRDQCIENVQQTYERLVPDAMINLPGASTPNLLVESRYRIKQGMGEDFTTFVKSEQIPALKKAGVGLFVLRRLELGGSRNVYIARRGISKMEELDANLIEKALGRDGATRYFAKGATMLTDVEMRVYQYRPEMSYGGAQ